MRKRSRAQQRNEGRSESCSTRWRGRAWRWAEGNEDRGVSIDAARDVVPGVKRSRLFLPLSLSLWAEPIKGAPLPLWSVPTVSHQKNIRIDQRSWQVNPSRFAFVCVLLFRWTVGEKWWPLPAGPVITKGVDCLSTQPLQGHALNVLKLFNIEVENESLHKKRLHWLSVLS